MDDIYVDPYTHGMYAYGANIVQYGNRVYMVYLSNVENDEGTYYMYLMAKEYDGSNWSDGVRIAYVGEADGSPFNASEGGPTICRDGVGYLHVSSQVSRTGRSSATTAPTARTAWRVGPTWRICVLTGGTCGQDLSSTLPTTQERPDLAILLLF